MKKIFFFSSLLSVFISCASGERVKSVIGTVRYNPIKDDTFTKKELKDYISKTKHPTIVLRVPSVSGNITENNTHSSSYVYGTIEKELTKGGFIVRDRSLFEKLSQDNKIQDYSKLKELTDTELILEVIRKEDIPYNTNKFTSIKGIDKIAPFNIRFYGEKVEFRIISVKDNDILGNYIFNYTPCVDGCTYEYNELGKKYILATSAKKAYEYNENNNELEEFYKINTQKLVNQLKK